MRMCSAISALVSTVLFGSRRTRKIRFCIGLSLPVTLTPCPLFPGGLPSIACFYHVAAHVSISRIADFFHHIIWSNHRPDYIRSAVLECSAAHRGSWHTKYNNPSIPFAAFDQGRPMLPREAAHDPHD